MVSASQGTDDVALKKVRKKKLADHDDSLKIKKKKKKLLASNGSPASVKKKKRKKKKMNSTVLDPTVPLTQEASDQESIEDLFGSQSPIKLPSSQIPEVVPSPEPEPLPELVNLEEEEKEEDEEREEEEEKEEDEEKEEEEEEDEPVTEPLPEPLPEIVVSPKKFAKKTKIIGAKESPKKKRKLLNEDFNCPLDAPEGKVSDVEEEVAEPPPLTDALMSQQEQDLRDMCLIKQIGRLGPELIETDVNWNSVFVFNMSPQEMQDRWNLLSKTVNRQKSMAALADEAMLAFCESKVNNIPMSSRCFKASRAAAPSSSVTRKVLNAFTLFSSKFDSKHVSREEIKSQWEKLEDTEKKKLRKEARLINNANDVPSSKNSGGEKKAKKATSGYNIFTKEQLLLGRNMVDSAAMWRNQTPEERAIYTEKAVALKREQTERKISGCSELGD